jgi:hypothetical protein
MPATDSMEHVDRGCAFTVMAGLVPAIRRGTGSGTDGRDKPGRDARKERRSKAIGLGCWYEIPLDWSPPTSNPFGFWLIWLRLSAN